MEKIGVERNTHLSLRQRKYRRGILMVQRPQEVLESVYIDREPKRAKYTEMSPV